MRLNHALVGLVAGILMMAPVLGHAQDEGQSRSTPQIGTLQLSEEQLDLRREMESRANTGVAAGAQSLAAVLDEQEWSCDNFGICSCSGSGDCFLMGNAGVCKGAIQCNIFGCECEER